MNLDGIIKKIIGNNIFIFGGGKTGAALLKFLVKFCQNLNIFIFDDSLSREYFLSLINSKLNNNNLFVNLNDENDLLSKIKNESDLKKLFLIVSPGIDLKKSDSFIASFNRKYSLYKTCDIELFLSILNEYKSYHTDICDIYTIGITGTNGKSTVSALTNYILNQNCTKSFIGGNFGIPIFELDKIFENIDEFKSIKKLFFVIELSSYQIDLINMSTFNLGAIINITSDHLERYDFDRNKYSLSKQKLINFSEKIIFGINDEECYKIFIERYLIEKEKDFDIDLKTKNIFFDKFFCAYYGPFDFDNNFLMNYKFNDINNKEELFELDFDEKINKVSSIIEEQGFSFNISNNKIIFNSKNLGIEFIQNTNLKGNHNLQNIIISYAISYIALKDIIED